MVPGSRYVNGHRDADRATGFRNDVKIDCAIAEVELALAAGRQERAGEAEIAIAGDAAMNGERSAEARELRGCTRRGCSAGDYRLDGSRHHTEIDASNVAIADLNGASSR